MSGSVSYGITAPLSWGLVHTRLCLCPPRVCFPCPVWVLVALWWGQWWPPPRGLIPHRGLLHPEPLPLWQATADPCLHRRHSNTVLTQFLWSLLVCTRFCLSALCISDGYEGLILNAIFPLLPSFWVFPFALGRGVSVFGGIQHSPVDGCSAAIWNFGVLTRENDHKSFYSTILRFWWGNEDNGDLLQKVPCTHYCTSTVSTPDPGAGHPIPHTNKHICKFTCICTVKNKEIFSLHTDYHIASNAICFSVAETISNWPPFLKTEQWFLLGILLLPRYI